MPWTPFALWPERRPATGPLSRAVEEEVLSLCRQAAVAARADERPAPDCGCLDAPNGR